MSKRMAKLSLERLEERAVPATATVVTLATDPLGTHTGISLRDAILAVKAVATTSITFNIPGTGVKTIAVAAKLPTIDRSVTIDATTEPGYAGTPLIALTRARNNIDGDGLFFTGCGATVKGLAVYGFGGNGLHFQGGG